MTDRDRPTGSSRRVRLTRASRSQAGRARARRTLLHSHASAGLARMTGEGRVLDAPHPALEPTADLRNERPGTLDKVVFSITALVSLAFVAWGLVSPTTLSTSATAGQGWVVTNAGWFFALAATGFVFFILWLAISPFGNIPLGRDGEGPEFRTSSWVAMMFSAGMGIGLMFYGAAEPLAHFVTPPPGTGGADNENTIRNALATTMFHWGLHPWAIYAVVGVAVAYGVFRKGRPLTMSAVFEPLLGRRQTYGAAGKVIDIFAIFATLFGSATSLGLGALQIMSGAQIIGWIDEPSNTALVVLITILTTAFIISAVSGVSRGIQYLSNINMFLAIGLALFVFVMGPTVIILNLLPATLGTYLQNLMQMSGRTGTAGPAALDWLAGWTIFYWAWWVSWTPFVGMFIARISRGRTIRQFVSGVLLLPSAVSLIWFSIFGGAAINAEQTGAGLSQIDSAEETLFALLGTMPWPTITAFIVMLLTSIFFVSGADAASVVMGTLSENGTIEPSRPTVIFWGAATGAVAAIMLIIAGTEALAGLQSITIMAGLPFMVVMIGMVVALMRDLRDDPMMVRRRYAAKAIDIAVVEGVVNHGDDFVLAVDPTPPGEGVGALVQEDEKGTAETVVTPPLVDEEGATRA